MKTKDLIQHLHDFGPSAEVNIPVKRVFGIEDQDQLERIRIVCDAFRINPERVSVTTIRITSEPSSILYWCAEKDYYLSKTMNESDGFVTGAFLADFAEL